MMNPGARKTWKRELAVVMLAYVAGLVAFTAWHGDDQIRMRLVEILFSPVMLFAALAFGMDWAAKGGAELFRRRNDDGLDS